MSSVCFEPEGSTLGRMHYSTNNIAYTDACKTYHTITVYTAIFLKMNLWVRNVDKTSKVKN